MVDVDPAGVDPADGGCSADGEHAVSASAASSSHGRARAALDPHERMRPPLLLDLSGASTAGGPGRSPAPFGPHPPCEVTDDVIAAGGMVPRRSAGGSCRETIPRCAAG
jgi:hypothetical protein